MTVTKADLIHEWEITVSMAVAAAQEALATESAVASSLTMAAKLATEMLLTLRGRR